MTKKKIEVVFAPGCFDSFEGTQEELDELVKEITEKFQDPEFLEGSGPVDFDSLSDEEIEKLSEAFQRMEGVDNRKLQ